VDGCGYAWLTSPTARFIRHGRTLFQLAVRPASRRCVFLLRIADNERGRSKPEFHANLDGSLVGWVGTGEAG